MFTISIYRKVLDIKTGVSIGKVLVKGGNYGVTKVSEQSYMLLLLVYMSEHTVTVLYI